MIKQNKEVAATPFCVDDKIAELLQKKCTVITVQDILAAAGNLESEEARQ